MNASLLSSLAIGALTLSSAGAIAADPSPAEDRVTRTAEGPALDHAADELRDPTSLQLTRRASAEIERKPRATAKSANALRAAYGDSYVYDATTQLFEDLDGDGYYHYLRVRFDADSVYSPSYVYAEIYLSADGNAWELLYTTKDFAVWGSDPDDDYEVETELVSGYSAGLYDVLIELHDADDGTLLDEFGPNESSALSLLPLEDSSRDGVLAPPPVAVSHGGGGAFSWLALPGLLAAVLLRRRRRAATPRARGWRAVVRRQALIYTREHRRRRPGTTR